MTITTAPAIRRFEHLPNRYVLAVLIVVAAHLLIIFSHELLLPATRTIFMGAIVVVAVFGGYGPSLLATGLAAVDLFYAFLAPFNSFQITLNNVVVITTFLVVAIFISTLHAQRYRAEESLRRARDELEDRVRDRTAELARKQAQLGLLVNGVVDQAFFMIDTKGVIASWNTGAQRLFGYSTGEIIGQPIARILPGSPLRDGTKSAVEEHAWALRRDGSQLWAALVITPMRGEGSSANGYAVALRDVTERRSLERDILEIAEREQERIGRDLHHGLGQELTGIALLSTALAERLSKGTPAETPAAAAEAGNVAELAHEAIRHTRDLARGLSPVNLEDGGLAAALELLCSRIDRMPGTHCVFQADPLAATAAAPLREATATHLYRIAQEATTNAIRHGKAAHIFVGLTSAKNLVQLTIRDDGGGLPAEGLKEGMGIRLMQHRAKMCRAALSITQATGGGTVVECRLDPNGAP